MKVLQSPKQFEEFRARLLDCTVGFVRSKFDQPPNSLGGSGTLVQAGGRKAILTADHVLHRKYFPTGEPFGLVALNSLPRQNQRIIINPADRLTIGRGTAEADGPDLALVTLFPSDVEKIEAVGKAFYNLSLRNARKEMRLPIGQSLCLCGMFGQLTQERRPDHGFRSAVEFRGLIDQCEVRRHRTDETFDYLTVAVNYAGAGVSSYGGCSGGGLWVARNVNGSTKAFLCGVPFHQSGATDGRGHLECHGPSSIYEVAARKLEAIPH